MDLCLPTPTVLLLGARFRDSARDEYCAWLLGRGEELVIAIIHSGVAGVVRGRGA